MPLSFHKRKKALHFKCLLDWIYMVCPIKLSIPARFSIGPQMMRWLMCWVWAACDSKHSSADRTRKHLDRKAAPEDLSLSITYYKEHWGKVSADLSCVEGWDEIYQRSPRSYTGWIFSLHKRRKLTLEPHTSSLTCLIMPSCYNM